MIDAQDKKGCSERPEGVFRFVGGEAVRDILAPLSPEILEIVRDTYLLHQTGQTVNPDSHFLLFPDRPGNRIIALPAYIGGQYNVAGIKWIASVPSNLTRGIPRASACIILNDVETGVPFACLEGSHISSARTAASALLGATVLNKEERVAACLSVVGCGVIARSIINMFAQNGWQFERVVLFDKEPNAAATLSFYVRESHADMAGKVTLAGTIEEAVSGNGVVIFTTTTSSPYIPSSNWFSPDAIILNISLRDIAPSVLLDAFNLVDDVDHCLKANTSPHLAEMLSGGRDFIAGTLAAAITREVTVPGKGLRIFSPFGLGVLDLAVAKTVYDIAVQTNKALPAPSFFVSLSNTRSA